MLVELELIVHFDQRSDPPSPARPDHPGLLRLPKWVGCLGLDTV
jgi:hypothetical protein